MPRSSVVHFVGKERSRRVATRCPLCRCAHHAWRRAPERRHLQAINTFAERRVTDFGGGTSLAAEVLERLADLGHRHLVSDSVDHVEAEAGTCQSPSDGADVVQQVVLAPTRMRAGSSDRSWRHRRQSLRRERRRDGDDTGHGHRPTP